MKRSLLFALTALIALAAMGGVAAANHDENALIEEFDVGADDPGNGSSPLTGRFLVLNSSNQPAQTGPRAVFVVGYDCPTDLTLAAGFVGDQPDETGDPDTIGAGGRILECEGEHAVEPVLIERHPGFDNFNSEEDLVTEGNDMAFNENNDILDIGYDEDTRGDSDVLRPFRGLPASTTAAE